MEGLVLSGSNNVFAVLGADGAQRSCAIKGKRLKGSDGAYNALAAGDRVELEPEPGYADKGLVLALLPRRNVFGRYNEKGRARQAIAANVDLVVCVSSPAFPPFRPRFVDRVAVLAEAAGVPLLIVLNKADLGADLGTRERLRGYMGLGYSVLETSAAEGRGIDELRSEIAGRTSVFAGQSGVGKSSLLNALEPGAGRRIGEISEKYARGKHTTTMAELLVLSDPLTRIIDTPGVRRLALRGIEPGELDAYFPELAPLAPDCAFGLSCTHSEEEGCRVARAVAEGMVHPDRYESYLRIRWELEANAEYRKKEGRKVPSKLRGDGARKTARFRGDDDDE